MTLTELRYIVALGQEQHFGRAAERCNVSQPTLSIAVKKLEDELGVTLFERAKQGVLVTPLGERIIAMASAVLERTAEIKDVATGDANQLQGPLALGTLPTVGPYLLPQFIPLLQEMANSMPLFVEEAAQQTLAAKLRNGDLDALLVTAPFSEPDIVVQPLFEEPLVLLVPARHRLASKATVALDDLDPAEVLLLDEGHAFRDQVLSVFPQLRPQDGASNTRTSMRGSTFETLRHMVASGLGVTVLPQAAAQAPLYSSDILVTKHFSEPAPKRTVVLAWRVSYPRHKAIDVLRRAIQASSAAYWNYNSARVPETAGLMIENRDW
ncbi:hydrogen peroxide-inducible genes activator [Steroidobacter sp.]|uniref:hydrogen peroxide-inducible genes activator n=1 Tax=Steroidobacter sp. TaxID=1978227 RepID=UPI001A43B44B|nr:hydrogen peroxide-inducible genes activator [Steroidobacter sp.]MBL8267822.1 hydrogen peroxide-inducible genes activator [Steroidobacter sp.]